MTWADRTLTTMQVTSNAGRDLAIRHGNPLTLQLRDASGQPVPRQIENRNAVFETERGGVYTLHFITPPDENLANLLELARHLAGHADTINPWLQAFVGDEEITPASELLVQKGKKTFLKVITK